MKTYIADRSKWSRSVKVQDGSDFYWLNPSPSQKVINHSPDGFEWGYGGSGPAQLALAILLDLFGMEAKELALHLYHDFKFTFIATADQEGFTLSEEGIRTWVAGQTANREFAG